MAWLPPPWSWTWPELHRQQSTRCYYQIGALKMQNNKNTKLAVFETHKLQLPALWFANGQF